MSNLKISPDLFLEVAELERLKQFLDTDGFRKNILQNSINFGLIRSTRNPTFTNSRVERDLDTVLGQRTIKVRELFGIDNTGKFLYSKETNGIPVPNDGNWYWVKVTQAYSNLEAGTFSISGNGDLIDTSGNAQLTKILRGMPNFPSRIKFTNSLNNTLEYDVLEVIDDQHATLQHPATSSNSLSQFEPESNLGLKVVGTFTPGIAVPEANKYPFNYDSALIVLVKENFVNQKPLPYTPEVDFYVARVKADQNTVLIQDKRVEYWETKGSSLPIEIDRRANPLIGVEAVRYNNEFAPGDKNIVEMSWGMRSSNWSVDASNNIVTFHSGQGGKYKKVDDFTNGDFDGWRFYTTNGKFSKILSSIKQGGAINFILDVLDVDNYSTDGGLTFTPGTLFATPDCGEVEILFTPHDADNKNYVTKEFVFQVNEQVAKCEVLVYADPKVFYNVRYRYKTLKNYTTYNVIPSDTVKGYLTEDSFNADGSLKSDADRVYFNYSNSLTAGFIQLQLSPNSLWRFRQKVDKGDIIGVQDITDLSTTTVVNMIVGTTKHYIYVSGAITIASDVYFSLDKKLAKDGNEFRIHFNCTSIGLSGKNIRIAELDAISGLPTELKVISVGDVFEMLNRDGGIIFTMKYDGSKWVISQNYSLGTPFEIKQIDGVWNDLFDTNGWGKVKGLYGHVVADGRNNTYDLTKLFLVGANQDINSAKYHVGATGGEEKHVLTSAEMSKHHHLVVSAPGSGDNLDTTNLVYINQRADTRGNNNYTLSGTSTPPTLGQSTDSGGDQPHENLPPFYAVIMAKKTY